MVDNVSYGPFVESPLAKPQDPFTSIDQPYRVLYIGIRHSTINDTYRGESFLPDRLLIQTPLSIPSLYHNDTGTRPLDLTAHWTFEVIMILFIIYVCFGTFQRGFSLQRSLTRSAF